jgi:hypothetical protein
MDIERIDREFLGELIGKGVQGSVFQYIGEDKWVIKKTAKRKNDMINKTETEIAISKKAGIIDVSPKIIDYIIIIKEKQHIGYIVMEKIIGRTLQKSDLNDETIIKKITNKINKLRNNKIEYGDYNIDNFLIGKPIGDEEEDVYIVDFGGSKYYENESDIIIKDENQIKCILTEGFTYKIKDEEYKSIREQCRAEEAARTEEAIKKILKKTKTPGGKTIKKYQTKYRKEK